MAEERDFRTRLSEALMAGGDTINQAFGGKQNIYGTYTTQKENRLKMEREAELARQKQMMDAYNRSLQSMASAKPTQQNVIGYDPATGINVLQPNPAYSPADVASEQLQKERKTYAGEGFLPIARQDIIGMDPMERMRLLRNKEVVRTSPDTGSKYMLGPEEMRRQEKKEGDKIQNYGRVIDAKDEKGLSVASGAIGMNPEDALAIGRVEATTVNGKPKLKILSDREWANRKRLFNDKEVDAINSRYDTAKSFKKIVTTLRSIGDLPKDKGIFEGIESEKVESGLPGLGVISIPARVKLASQYAKDPRYTAVKRELEAAFSSYRKIVTGAQAAASELVYLRDIFPSLTDKPEVFLSTIDAIIERNGRELETKLNTWEDAGRDVKKFRERYDSEYKPEFIGLGGSAKSQSGGQFEDLAKKKGVTIRFKS